MPSPDPIPLESGPGTAITWLIMLHVLFKKINPGPYLALHLAAGLFASVLFMWIFSGIAESVLDNEPLVALDIWVMEKIVSFRSPIGNAVMQTVTRFGGILFVGPATALIVCILLIMKQNAKAAVFAWVILGGYILNLLLKEVIHRPRPVSVTALAEAGGWSFPSGHAMAATIFYGMFAYLLVKGVDSRRLKIFIIIISASIVFLIGLSRIYLQVHYVSDVLAGYAGGCFWLAVCITGFEAYDFGRRAKAGYS